MTVVQFETWRKWVVSSGKTPEEINEWLTLPVEESNQVRASVGLRLWWDGK